MFCVAEGYGALRNVPYFGGNKKRIWSAGACWKSERSLLRKTKTKQMQRCNPPRFKTNRRTRGSRNHVIPYFEGFTIAAICWNQSERSPFRKMKNERCIIATLQKPEGSLWHTEWLHIAIFGEGTIIFMLGMERGQHGTIRGHGQDCICRLLFSFWAFCCMME